MLSNYQNTEIMFSCQKQEVCVDIKRLYSELNERRHYNPVNFNPIYQRGLVWDVERQEQFLGAWLSGMPMPKIFIQQNENSPEREVIDGKQRLTALVTFATGSINAKMFDGAQFDIDSAKRTGRIPDVRLTFVNLPIRLRMQFYVMLNSGGVAHTREEITRVVKLIESGDLCGD